MKRKSRARRRLPLKRQPAPCLTLDTPAHLAHSERARPLRPARAARDARGAAAVCHHERPFLFSCGDERVETRAENSDRSGGSSAHSRP